MANGLIQHKILLAAMKVVSNKSTVEKEAKQLQGLCETSYEKVKQSIEKEVEFYYNCIGESYGN